ncbi:RNA 2',3'-cyclic phosphodiesterase [Kitasatospora sp. GP82]|uniref:RNA 2',3'-cyclic phosphodiesterase n=1 Tax=Kitasatospora sp. GP82 TaxID=3035089 RepID=UPI002473180E|nr:RNA 2',3'-cyclic phosphodiesterase [Kitasatospora sp. GP82]MDH6126232.1 2'-5' RNA ligase [Kitasatospora sp. GP82]
MRLFVAVDPPVEAVQELVDAMAPLREMPGADRLRWTGVDGWHLTLAFLGEVPVLDVPGLEEVLGRAATENGAHRLRLAGGGCFGDRVLWAGVEGETWALRRLAEAVREGVGELGIETDQYGFHPHLTLARAGSRHGRRRAEQRSAPGELQAMAAGLEGFAGREWEAGELHLMRSDLGFGPARYERLHTWPLARWEAP